MNLRPALIALLAGIALGAPLRVIAETPARAVTATIDGVPFVLPVPVGFTDPAATPKSLVELCSHTVPAGNRLVAMMIPMTLLQKFVDHDKTANLSRFVTVLDYVGLESTIKGAAEFEQLKTTLRNQGPAVRQRATEVAAQGRKDLSAEVAKRTGGPAPDFGTVQDAMWGVFDEQPNSISMTTLQTSTTADAAGPHAQVQVIGMAILRMRGKLVGLGVYSDFASAADVSWAKEQVGDWVRRMNALNP
jgi:hypothetical protein